MSLIETIDLKWRSTNFNSDVGQDESKAKTINKKIDLLNDKYSDKSILKATCNNGHDKENETVVAEGLLNAMNNLHIASETKLQPLFQHPIIYGEDSTQDNDKQIDDSKVVQVGIILPEGIQSEMEHMSNNAMKLMSAQSPKKVTNIASPQLSTQLKSGVNVSMNHFTSKRVVKTIANTNNGVHLKNEKINFFGIPVTTNRKKHTQVKPFNFQSRTKKNQLTQASCKSTVPSKSSCLHPMDTIATTPVSKLSRHNSKMNEASKVRGSTIVLEKMDQMPYETGLPRLHSGSYKNVTMRKCTTKVSENKTKINVENNITNKSAIGWQGIKPEQTTVGHKLHTDQRQHFKLKLKQRELEIEDMRARVEQKKRDKERPEEKAIRSRLEIKGKPIPALPILSPKSY